MEYLLRKNVIEQGMADIMGTWYDRMLDDGDLKPHVIVYLRTTPPVALSRLQARARSAENSVILGQLLDIHDLHEEWLEQVHLRNSAYEEPEMPDFTIDADLQLNDVYHSFCMVSFFPGIRLIHINLHCDRIGIVYQFPVRIQGTILRALVPVCCLDFIFILDPMVVACSCSAGLYPGSATFQIF
ncbi:deoxynucleoside kinase-like [Bradysia coprophila]|uniref:deoxynucleoside kinase-like n=1 Tax=Bradysia coprophila TaxID=38358 RepID=UPI00187DB3C9|nr:deoxynucleoside kinase-like [Bradysia coprophila]